MTASYIKKVQKPDYEKQIEGGLKLWLKETRGIDAIFAELHESEVERGWSTGCDTCGYGADDDTITTTVGYHDQNGKYGSVSIDGTSINFLPELLDYIYRADIKSAE